MFNAGVIGSAPLTFQWFKDGDLLAGAVAPTGHIQCAGRRCRRLSNSGFKLFGIGHQRRGDVDGAARRPSFVLQPLFAAAVAGSNVVFDSLAVGSDDDLNPIRYAWYFRTSESPGKPAQIC